MVNSKVLRRLHRWVGLLFSLTVMMSAGSGVLHTVMSRTQPPPPKAAPAEPVPMDRVVIGVREAFDRVPKAGSSPRSVSIRTIGTRPWYQFILPEGEGTHYVSADTGEYDALADELYAREIASGHLAGAQARRTAYLEEYDEEYINIFRILPVYRFDVEDRLHTRVYVSTMTGSVTRHTDDRRQWEASIFSNVHKFMFIKDKDLRDTALVFATLGAFVVSVIGVLLFSMSRK